MESIKTVMPNLGDALSAIAYPLVAQITSHDTEGKLSRREVNVKYNNPKLVVHRIYKRLFSISLTGQR